MAVTLSVTEQMRRLQHQPGGTPSFGCASCPHQRVCGGLSLNIPIMSCRDLCECTDEQPCNAVCPRRPEAYIAYMNEVDGFDLLSLPLAPATPTCQLPHNVPVIYGRSRRAHALRTSVAAVPLSAVIRRSTGLSRFGTRDELMDAFLIDRNAKLVLSGVDHDWRIEPYWSQARDANIVDALRRLHPDLVTVPNFSLFSNVPRHDNLVNMKRIAICWVELAMAGISTALHVNARTQRDWERWAEFIRHQQSVSWIAFEFATGARINHRGDWYVRQLIWLAEQARRPLNIVVRGTLGMNALRNAYQSVTLLDTVPYSKSHRRFKAVRLPTGRIKWRRSWTLFEQPVDDILQHNVDLTSCARRC